MTVAVFVGNPEGSKPGDGRRVLEAWESDENARRFRDERLTTPFDAAGTPRPQVPPQIRRSTNPYQRTTESGRERG
jgi:hypothetical protein